MSEQPAPAHTPTKTTPMSPGKGHQWLDPEAPIEQGDEALFWPKGAPGPIWTPCVNSIGKKPADAGFFIRRKNTTPAQAKAAKKTKPADPAVLP